MDKDTKIFGIFEDDVTEEEAADMCASKDACKTCDEEYDTDTLEGQGWEKVESKYVTDESGFQDIYYWYKNPKSGLHRFYFTSDVDYGDPEYFDWETENEQEAKDWFDSYGEDEESEYLDFQSHDTRTGDDYDANERVWGKDTDLDESNKANSTLEEQGWELIASKTVPVEGGFHDKEGKMKTSFPYYWYKKDGNNRFFFFNQSVDADDPSNFDFETTDDEKAKSWFDSFGEYEEELGEGKKLHEDSDEDEGEPVETKFDELDYLTDLFNVERLPKDNSVPAFKESAVNEFQFPKGMRAKYYNAWNDGDSLFVEWITQEPFTAEDADAFKKEVERFFQYTVDHAHFEYPKTVKVKATCRDGKEDGFVTFELKFGDKAKAECVSLKEANSELEDLIAVRLNKFYDILSRNATVTLTNSHLDKVYYEGSVRDIPAKYDDCVVEDFAFDGGNALLFKIKVEDTAETLTEDTVKLKDGKWVNKGKEGTHGTFRTKKAADAQRKAMFAQGYKESLSEDIEDDDYDDFELAGIYGGDLTYCPICGKRLEYDEDGDHFCPKCKKSAWDLAQDRHEMDKRKSEDLDIDMTSISNDNTPSGDALAIADDLVYAIKDEWDTVTLYNNIIAELEEASKNGQDFDDIIPVIKDIVKEENTHIGQLQKALSTISPDTDDIANGEMEAEGQLTEDLNGSSDDISDWDFACQLEPYADDGVEVAYKDTLEVDYPREHRRKTPRDWSRRKAAMERSIQMRESDNLEDTTEEDVCEAKSSCSNADYIRDAWQNGYLKDDDLITYFLDKTPDGMLAELRISAANAKKNLDPKTTADDLSFADINTVLSDPNAKFLTEDTTSMNVSVEADSPAAIKAEVKMDPAADVATDTFDVVGNPEEDDLSIADVELV